METPSSHSNAKSANWQKISRIGILLCTFLIIFFIVSMAVKATWDSMDSPYRFFVVGLEIALTALLLFFFMKMDYFKPNTTDQPVVKLPLPEHFKSQNEHLQLLWRNVTHDINKYENRTTYYLGGVKFYKYSTIILAGISTILLGIEPNGFTPFGIEYNVFAKNTALILGVIITAVTSISAYWNIEKYWLTNKTIVNKLRALRDDIEDISLADPVDKTLIESRMTQYDKIRDTFNDYWEGALSKS